MSLHVRLLCKSKSLFGPLGQLWRILSLGTKRHLARRWHTHWLNLES